MTEEATEVRALDEPSNSRVVFVDTIEGLNAAVVELAGATGPFALDAERASGFKYSQRAYLIQIMRGDSAIYLIDPIPLTKMSLDGFENLAKLLKTAEWILHAATQDLPCLNELGLAPSKIFDTELAGRLLGMPRVGLGALCEQWLGLSLAKEHSAVDWSTRPLKEEWLNYAALDVDVLIDLRNSAEKKLIETGKHEWALEEFENLLSFRPKPTRPDKWRSMSGLHELKDQRSLAIARELWIAREELASKMDVSPGRLIPDGSIITVAKNKPKSRSALAGDKSFVGRASRTYLDTWWEAYSSGNETLSLPDIKPKAEGIPNHRNWESRHPEAHQRLQKLRPIVLAISEEHSLPIENLLQPDLLRTLCWQPPEDSSQNGVGKFLLQLGARNWQVNLVAKPLSSAMNPESS